MDFDQPATDSSALLSQSHTACEITLVRNMCTVVNFYHFGNSSVSVLGKAQFSFEGRFRFRLEKFGWELLLNGTWVSQDDA